MNEEGVPESVARRRLRERRWNKAKGFIFPLIEDVVPLGRTLTKGAKVVESVVRNKDKNG